jgi:hypothetical protein
MGKADATPFSSQTLFQRPVVVVVALNYRNLDGLLSSGCDTMTTILHGNGASLPR